MMWAHEEVLIKKTAYQWWRKMDVFAGKVFYTLHSKVRYNSGIQITKCFSNVKSGEVNCNAEITISVWGLYIANAVSH
jgi:hypothetical protein